MIRTELEAEAELRKLLTELGGAGVTAELSVAIRDAAEAVSRAFPSSDRVSVLYQRIVHRSQPAAQVEPDSCLRLRERLTDPISTNTILAALRHSGFIGRKDMSLREDECFSVIIRGPLQTLRAQFEGTDGVTPERLQTRIASLRELLEALPPEIPGPRQVVAGLIHQLELSTSNESFRELLKVLRKRVEEQELDTTRERLEVQSNLWAKDNPDAVEVSEARKCLARLEELQRASSTQLADADRLRDLIKQGNYDQALNEVNLWESRLRQTGLSNREPLDEVLAKLFGQLMEVYKWEETAFAGRTPSESVLHESLLKLQHLSGWLQKWPNFQLAEVETLRKRCAALEQQRGQQLNELLLGNARKELHETAVEDVPAYVQPLRSSDRALVRDWARKVQIVWDAIQQVSKVEDPVDTFYLGPLESAERELGPSPLSQAAQLAARDYKNRVAREYLQSIGLLVQAIEQSAVNLAVTGNPVQLSDTIASVAKSISQYRQMQDRDPETLTIVERVFHNECIAYDQRVRDIRQTKLPEAANRWAQMIILAARSQEDLLSARQTFAAWSDALGVDFPHSEIQRRFAERSAELEIEALEGDSKFEEALRLLEERRTLLSDKGFLDIRGRLRRRLAARDYQPGHEAEIATAIREYGPEPKLLSILVTDFRSTGNCRDLASIHECLHEIEIIDPQTAQLVKWSFDFQSENFNVLSQELVSPEAATSASLFAKGLATGDQHAAGLRVLGSALKEPHGWNWLPEPREAVEASYEILAQKFAAECVKIEGGLQQLQESSQTAGRFPFKNYALLGQQIDEAFAGAKVFLAQAIPQVARWLKYLSVAKRLGVEFELSLLTGVQDLEQLFFTNSLLLDRLSQARRAAAQEGWEKLADLNEILNSDFTPRIAPVALVGQLLRKYLENYPTIPNIVGRLVDAHRKGGDGLSRQELNRDLKELTEELKYDFRPGHDHFQQVARFEGRTFSEFKEALETMVTEVEAVAAYDAQLKRLLVGKGGLSQRVDRGSDLDKRDIAEMLRKPDSNGKSILDLYRNPPQVSTSTVAVDRLRNLQRMPWYDLLKRAVDLTDQLQ